MPASIKTGLKLSIVVPTFNERGNVAKLVSAVDAALRGVSWEIIFVDDNSPDGTAATVREIARQDRRVRLISRHDRRGLSSAVVEGTLAAAAEIVAVMDGDLQHDETVLPALFRTVAEGRAEIATASRFLQEGGASGLSSERRLQISNAGIRLANRAFGLDLTDPLTGFFAFRRDVMIRALPNLSGTGFKILLDLIAAAQPQPKVVEVPFRFRPRIHGESKLDNRILYDFFLFFIEKKISSFLPIPARFISFCLINGFGILVHLVALAVALNIAESRFVTGQLVAALASMAFIYAANNALAYRDRQLKGAGLYVGLTVFALLCSPGIYANVGIASLLHREAAGAEYLAPAFTGASIGIVWNHVAMGALVWGKAALPRLRLGRRERRLHRQEGHGRGAA